MQSIKLNNGVTMPLEGFGVFQVTDLNVCEQAVAEAIEVGNRLIDTASVYMNEEAVGRAIAKSGVPREEFFVTSKVYIQDMGYEKTKAAFYTSLKKLGMDYLDLYLIHQPLSDVMGAWRVMEELYRAGKIRAIGVCNFDSSRLTDLCYNTDVVPAVNQIECHPFYQRSKEIDYMKSLGIQPEAWSPFAEGQRGIFSNPLLQEIGKAHDKTPAQVILRWNVQRGVAVIPKSVHKNRMEENIAIWDFELSVEEMEKIGEMDTGKCVMLDLADPNEVKRVYEYLKNPRLR